MRTTNILLGVIAVLLAVIAAQQYEQRPVTIGELTKLLADEQHEAWQKRRDQAPVSFTSSR